MTDWEFMERSLRELKRMDASREWGKKGDNNKIVLKNMMF